jgi:hypothetical protein
MKGDRGTCCGRGWGSGPCVPSARGSTGMATAADDAAATATATGRAASPEKESSASAAMEAGRSGWRLDDQRGFVGATEAGKAAVGWNRRRRTGEMRMAGLAFLAPIIYAVAG